MIKLRMMWMKHGTLMVIVGIYKIVIEIHEERKKLLGRTRHR
jgi:hypothetical protein